MYLRFENSVLAEASPVIYRSGKFTWYPAPADYDPANVYLLDNGTVVQATTAQKLAADLVAYKTRTQDKARTISRPVLCLPPYKQCQTPFCRTLRTP